MRVTRLILAAATVAIATAAPATAAFTSGGANEANTARTATVFQPRSSAAPTITGTPAQHQTLTGDDGTWERQPTTRVRAWLRCATDGASCAEITGATEATYRPVPADVGKRLRYRVTAGNAGGQSIATSAATDLVQSALSQSPSQNTTAPAISGTAREEWTLTSTGGTWLAAAPNLTYAWLRCDAAGANCVPITGESLSWYVPQAVDVGKTIRSQVTATVDGESTDARSAPSAVIAGLALTSGGRLPDALTHGFHLGFSNLKFGAEGAMPGSSAAHFAGSGAEARRNSPSWQFSIGTGEFSIQAWVRVPRGPKSDSVPIIQRYECGQTCTTTTKGAASANWDLAVGGGGRPRFQVRDDHDRTPMVDGTTDLRDGRWHLITATLSRATPSATMRLYVDGTLQGTNVAPLGAITDDQGSSVTVGCWTRPASHSSCDLTPTGRVALDDIALYRSALSTERVAAHWQGRSSAADFRAAAQADSAFVFWPLDGPM